MFGLARLFSIIKLDFLGGMGIERLEFGFLS